MRRYVLSRLIDFTMPSGQVVRLPALDTVRLPDGTSVAHVIHEQAGWVLSVVSHPLALPNLRGLPDVTLFPDVSHDVEWQAVDQGSKNRVRAALEGLGGVSPDLPAGAGFRQYVRQIGRQADPNFHEDNFGVPG